MHNLKIVKGSPAYLFYFWMAERHRIWRRRFVDLEEPPWTEDEVLLTNKFTNVYRELDRGTLFYMDHVLLPRILRAHVEAHSYYELLQELVWSSVIYRFVNRVETFEEVPVPHCNSSDALNAYFGGLHARRERGEPVMTSAHLTHPCLKGMNKVEMHEVCIIDLSDRLGGIARDIMRISAEYPYQAEGAKRIHRLLQQVRTLGHFTAYEVLCDLMNAGAIPYTEDTWANAGPGAKRGLTLIFGAGMKDWLGGMRILQKHQPAAALRYPELWFDQYHGLNSKLTLRVIEHDCCEFYKYVKVREATGKAKVGFNHDRLNTEAEGHEAYVRDLHKRVNDAHVLALWGIGPKVHV